MIQAMQSQTGPVEPPLKLHYFYIRGTAQPIRNLLYYLQVPFEDSTQQLTPHNDMEVGFGIGLPLLEDGDIKVRETIAIMYYICRKYGREDMIGLTPQTNARIQEILMKYTVQRKKIMTLMIETLRGISQAADKVTFVDQFLRKLSKQCSFMEFCLKAVLKPQKTVLDSISIVDFVFYELCFYLNGFFGYYIPKESEFRHYIQAKVAFEQLPFYKKNVNHILQKYLFHAFSSSEMNKTIQNNWKGEFIPLLKTTATNPVVV